MADVDRPLLTLGLPDTPETFAIRRASTHCIELLTASGLGVNEIFSVLLSSVWMLGNIVMDNGIDIEERRRLIAAVHSLADLLEAAAARKDGKLS